ncbi:MAG TPA: hypothetical protein VGF56_07555, partial [Rhizomicrobium sp.]
MSIVIAVDGTADDVAMIATSFTELQDLGRGAGAALKRAVIGWNHKQTCHGPRMRATQVVLLFFHYLVMAVLFSKSSVGYLGGPHSRAM